MSTINVRVNTFGRKQLGMVFLINNIEVSKIRRDEKNAFSISVAPGRKEFLCLVEDDKIHKTGMFDRTQLTHRYAARSDVINFTIDNGKSYTWEIDLGEIDWGYPWGTSRMIFGAFDLFGLGPSENYYDRSRYPKRIKHSIA